MALSFEDYVYSKQYIFIESKNSKFSESPYEAFGEEDVEDNLYSVVTSVTQKTVNGVKKHLIQSGDKKLGWIEMKDSIQIYRFKPVNFQVIESNFQSNDLNRKMGIEKDFISHFKDKLLTVKSEITYNNERYYSVFLKNKFHGFHHESHLDPLYEVSINLTEDNIKETELFILSNLTKPVSDVPKFEKAKLLSVFPNNLIGKIQLDKSIYWISLRQLQGFKLPEFTPEYKDIEQLRYDDLTNSVNETYSKAKKMLKTIISAKDYINNTNVARYLKLSKDNSNTKDNVQELRDELNSYKSENLDLKRNLRKEQNELKLTKRRLEHQLDYKERLESQRDKYKERMNFVNNKLKDLNEKYKVLKAQIKVKK